MPSQEEQQVLDEYVRTNQHYLSAGKRRLAALLLRITEENQTQRRQ